VGGIRGGDHAQQVGHKSRPLRLVGAERESLLKLVDHQHHGLWGRIFSRGWSADGRG
jgi:hypothetical protein